MDYDMKSKKKDIKFGSISIYIDNKKKNNISKSISIPSRKPSIWIPNEKRYQGNKRGTVR